MSWQQTAQTKRKDVEARIPAEWRIPSPPAPEEQVDVSGEYIRQFLDSKEVEITETDAVGIAQRVAEGRWTAVEVARGFCHRAAVGHQLTNCLLEIFFDDALEQARELDDYFAKNGKTKGPLHGVPVSLKDQFHVKGQETTMGYVGWVGTFQGKKDTGKERVYESLMVEELRELGAVLYCKTSVPHTLMCGETVNNIMGYCLNPRNRNLSSGGSSGGEGALIGLRGSPLGVGTDIGGSIRIPAAFNGLYGIRPSAGRLPYEGMANSMDGQGTVLSVVGPLATTAGALRLFVQAILSTKPWLHDPMVVEMPWRQQLEDEVKKTVDPASKAGKMAFGLLTHDGSITVHPPVRRAVELVASTLKKLGHEIVEWKPPPHKEIVDVGLVAWTGDGARDLYDSFQLSGETPAPNIAKAFGHELGEEQTASAIAANNVRKRELQKGYMEYWNSTEDLTGTGRPVDAVIMPVAPFAAARPGRFPYFGYSMFVNVLDYTSVIVPVTQCDKNVDKVDGGFRPVDEFDQKHHEFYDPEVYHGAHVSVQLVGRRFQEEKMIALAEYVGNALKS